MDVLDLALSMRLGLTADDAAYDVPFISQKIAVCSKFQEDLADAMARLARINIEVHRVEASLRGLLPLKELQFKGTSQYEQMDRDKKSLWLTTTLEPDRLELERWNGLKRAVSEVQRAVNEKAQTMKRLDSDLRLQAKLFETRYGAGATSPVRPTASAGSQQTSRPTAAGVVDIE